uniref:Subtilisin-like protease n=1 Tax=Oryza brachyantha TaxID=4533 RepID=J3LVC7_ORYBR
MRRLPQTAAMAIVLLALLLPLQRLYVVAQQNESKKLYVVYLGPKQHDDPEKTTASHHDMLTTILGSKEEAIESIIYSYRHGFSGFAAKLTESQAQQLSELPEVRSIKLSTVHPLHTTHSQDFLGLDYMKPTGLLHDAKHGDGVIIGIIDTGIWPESKSFSDNGLGPVPSKWKGICQAGQNFTSDQCNRKIIGARWYDKHLTAKDLERNYRSARDIEGHGTHVASTAAGALVPNISFNGLAAGYARGTAPRARIAVYKACWKRQNRQGGCDITAVLQAIDHAILDGVDVLSLSLGGAFIEYYGSLHAVNNGITVVFSAGNEGPAPRTVKNASPWGISVASASMDRAFPTVITATNKQAIICVLCYINRSCIYAVLLELVCACRCQFGTLEVLNVTLAAGKIVLCYSPATVSSTSPTYTMGADINALKEAGAKGIIFATYAFDLLDGVQQGCGSMPCVLVDFEVANQILLSSVDATKGLVVKVAPARTWIGDEVLAPKISTFSSRGPSPLLPEFLKPDIAAPGANILAAVGDSYMFMSGTSMACPHVSGVAALLKALHPDWSPAIIKSAMVTTASNEMYGLPILANGLPQKIADPFDFGGGFIDPNRAADPGLAYDINPKDYVALDCEYTNTSCEYQYLNLPSIAVPNLKASATVLRTLTNVGQADVVYKAVVQPPPGVHISVEPSLLRFRQGKKKLSFKVTFSMARKVQGGYLFGSLAWYDGGAHYVRIPIAVRPVVSNNYADVS